MKNRLFVNNNTIILFLFIIGSILFIELNSVLVSFSGAVYDVSDYR